MGTKQQHGFTIVEISLFVAISGLLALGLLTGWSVAINGQRYKDSVDSTYAYIQQQYSLVYSVENERSGTLSCDSSSNVSSSGLTSARGQSNCVLIGRYLQLTDGSTIKSYAIVGNEPSGNDNELQDYIPKVVKSTDLGLTQSEYSIPWGAFLTGKGNSNPLNVGIAIIRSPQTGTVYSYINSTNADITDLSSVISDVNQKEQYLCVRPDNGPASAVQGGLRAVYIPEFSASLNSVETIGKDSGC